MPPLIGMAKSEKLQIVQTAKCLMWKSKHDAIKISLFEISPVGLFLIND